MYLGPSPLHARSVHLILSIKQVYYHSFYVKFDELEGLMPRSEWQYKARLVIERSISTPDLGGGTMTQINRQTEEYKNTAIHKFNH